MLPDFLSPPRGIYSVIRYAARLEPTREVHTEHVTTYKCFLFFPSSFTVSARHLLLQHRSRTAQKSRHIYLSRPYRRGRRVPADLQNPARHTPPTRQNPFPVSFFRSLLLTTITASHTSSVFPHLLPLPCSLRTSAFPLPHPCQKYLRTGIPSLTAEDRLSGDLDTSCMPDVPARERSTEHTEHKIRHTCSERNKGTSISRPFFTLQEYIHPTLYEISKTLTQAYSIGRQIFLHHQQKAVTVPRHRPTQPNAQISDSKPQYSLPLPQPTPDYSSPHSSAPTPALRLPHLHLHRHFQLTRQPLPLHPPELVAQTPPCSPSPASCSPTIARQPPPISLRLCPSCRLSHPHYPVSRDYSFRFPCCCWPFHPH